MGIKLTTAKSEKDEKDRKKARKFKLTTARLEKDEKNRKDVWKSLMEGHITRSDAIAKLCDYGWSALKAKAIVSQWIEQAKLNADLGN